MKILAVVSTLDLRFRLGCTPAWWQLFKALHEIGNEVIAIPYLGKPVESIWWRTYDNPCYRESVIFNSFLEWRKGRGVSPSGKIFLSPIFDFLVAHYIRPRWEKHLSNILQKEKGVDFVLFMSVPINHIKGIPLKIKAEVGVPVIFYDGDMPTILPEFVIDKGFKFNYYENADLSEFDAFFTNSKGCIPELEKMRARNVYPLYYGVDPLLLSPIDIEKDIDIFFFGYGSDYREEWMTKMITNPSRKLQDVNFVVAGKNFKVDLGNAKMIGDLSYSEWRRICCRSKINLNITSWSHANIYASSTSRPFELAAMGACIVSQPYNGIEEWFEIGKELLMVNSEEEAVEAYRWLLDNEEEREKIGRKARERVLREHTFKHRAQELLEAIRKCMRG